ncbi:ParM/StbA family protein [Heyndrickxia camelliae]|uniref:Actin-like protein N-terminal domain-containing protein n=1 Tax=Heyndrickxia camelliae TaxID=1707093 RepID=A0A2N3LDZ6_9BACI|nr:ParM/StbA family protein [Heyndrickxia camelliae]PKR82870.1 hypothetical protein CWO92_22025 [Heyndrickxia camelliae]
MKLGIDAGNDQVKICGDYGLINFISAIGESRLINLQQIHGQDDMYFEYQGESGFAGTLALYESEFVGSIMGSTKAHKDTLLRVLIGIHRYSTLYNLNESIFDIVVGQPIIMHNHIEKEKIKGMLKGQHTLTVNGITKTFIINRVECAAECATAYWSNPKEGLVRIIDIGGGTVNYSTVLNGRFIDKDSDTLTFGVNTTKTNNLQALARGISTQLLKKWDQNDKTFLIGGIAEQMVSHLKNYFPNARVLYPIFNRQQISPIFANAISFYILAVNIYE